jgi:hypothetical protein
VSLLRDLISRRRGGVDPVHQVIWSVTPGDPCRWEVECHLVTGEVKTTRGTAADAREGAAQVRAAIRAARRQRVPETSLAPAEGLPAGDADRHLGE